MATILLLLLLLVLALPPPPSMALTAEGLALLAFKQAATADPYRVLARWSESDPDPCRWPGIICANTTSSTSSPSQHVVGIAVAGKNISGYIPSELGSLLFLRRLNLHSNRLTGSIPAALSNASSLRSVYLYNNRLTGALPAAALCDLPRLQNLDLSGNLLSGGIPLDLRGCRSLQRLILARNQLAGEVPAGIWPEMGGSLRELDLSSNKLNGTIPPDLGELGRLTGTLNLSRNRFDGPVPPELGRLPATVALDLRFNNLSGAIPQTGSLASQGPTAFLNNPGLCGYPLQVPCRAVAPPTLPPPASTSATTTPYAATSSGNHHGTIKTSLIALISAADAAGVALVGIILVYIYWKLKDRRKADDSGSSGKSSSTNNAPCRCCISLWAHHRGSDDDESATDESDSAAAAGSNKYNSGSKEGGGEEGELVSIDKAFRVDLDELLRSSAYVLGKGGKGIVYKVVVANGTTPVAVRRLGGGGGGPERCREFAAEARAVGRVSKHPNVVRLRAYYWAADEKLVVTDFVGNGNLANALRGRPGQTPLSWSARLKIARGAARGLAHLHECKFVHGEVKPSNILLEPDLTARVADFGLARLLAAAGCAPDAPPTSTTSGGLLGGAIPYAKPSPLPAPTPGLGGYGAPEARGPGAKPAQKWDVFSFGVVLLELLTGRGPGGADHASPSTSASFSAPVSGSTAATTDRSGSGEHLGGGGVPEVVRWVRRGFEEDARPVADMVDPALLRGGPPLPKKEVVAAFHVALACTEVDPEMRPRMKAVADSLDKIGS